MFFGFCVQPFENGRQGSLEPFCKMNTLGLAGEESTSPGSNTGINKAFAFSNHVINVRFPPHNEHESQEN
jgi:hypothetical protein